MPKQLGKHVVTLSVLLILTGAFNSNAVSQERGPWEVRASTATKKFSGAYQIAVAFHLSPPHFAHEMYECVAGLQPVTALQPVQPYPEPFRPHIGEFCERTYVLVCEMRRARA